MIQRRDDSPQIGLLLSGGVDSAVLLGHLVAQGYHVQPFYVRSHLFWERAELEAARNFIRQLKHPQVESLLVFDQPVRDVYQNHWSITGLGVPDAHTADEAVYLPGRNALLVLKPALWCQMHNIPELALAGLKANPFPDATPEFFSLLGTVLGQATGGNLRITAPFSHLNKSEVLQLGKELPLEYTFSCIDPVGGQHCGQCNKCAERQKGFRLAEVQDLTVYTCQPAL